MVTQPSSATKTIDNTKMGDYFASTIVFSLAEILGKFAS